jgi:aryl-alcohol dehydrogenase
LKTALGFGATHTINSSTTDPVQKIQEITGGGVEYTLECTGIPMVLRQGFEALATGGACGLIGAAPAGSQVTFDTQTILSGGRILRGVIMGDSIPDVFIPQLIDFYKAGRFPFDRMITFYPMDQINQAAEDSEKGKALKAILRP